MLIAGDNVTVTGTGSVDNPYVIEAEQPGTSGLFVAVTLGGNYGSIAPLLLPPGIEDASAIAQATLLWAAPEDTSLITPRIVAPMYDDDLMSLAAEVVLQVTNLAGTETFSTDIPFLELDPGQAWEASADSDWNVGPQVGADLNQNGVGGIHTIAGGIFHLILSTKFLLSL